MSDQGEKESVMAGLKKILESRKSSYWVPPVAQIEGDDFVFFKLKPEDVRYVNYEQSSSEEPKPNIVNFSLS